MNGRPMNEIRCRGLTLLALLTILLGTVGCAGALMTPLYLLKGNEVDPEFKKEVKALPKESTIVVICRSPYQNLFGSDNPSRTMSLMLTKLMSEKLEKKKFKWVSIDRVEALFDESAYANESYEKMGAKVDADYVIGVDIDSFSTRHSPQYYQGKARVHVRLVEVATGKLIMTKALPQYTYPPNAPWSVNDVSQEDFQNIFLMKLANEVGCLFYPYEKAEKYALDNDVARLRH